MHLIYVYFFLSVWTAYRWIYMIENIFHLIHFTPSRSTSGQCGLQYMSSIHTRHVALPCLLRQPDPWNRSQLPTADSTCQRNRQASVCLRWTACPEQTSTRSPRHHRPEVVSEMSKNNFFCNFIVTYVRLGILCKSRTVNSRIMIGFFCGKWYSCKSSLSTSCFFVDDYEYIFFSHYKNIVSALATSCHWWVTSKASPQQHQQQQQQHQHLYSEGTSCLDWLKSFIKYRSCNLLNIVHLSRVISSNSYSEEFCRKEIASSCCRRVET